VVLGVTLLLTGAMPQPRDSASAMEIINDIPGTPWTGNSSSSTVGGPVFDRVWRLELEAGKVVVIQTSGAPGAEIGLYIFGGFTTSVQTDLPLKSSALPGSRQSIVASLPAGSYYVNVNGRNPEREYAFTITLAMYTDLTPPELDPILEGNQTRVSGSVANVDTKARDALSGVTGVRYRYPSENWSEWSTEINSLKIALPIVDGSYALEVQAKNGLDLLSEVRTLNFIVDRISPTAQLLGNIRYGNVQEARPTIRYLFSEDMSAASLVDSVALSDFRGNRIPGKTIYDPGARIVTFVPSELLQLGQPYSVNLVAGTDTAGNYVIGPGGILFAYRKATRLMAELTFRTFEIDDVVKLKGAATGIPDYSILDVEFQAPGETWRKIGAATTSAGRFIALFTTTESGLYRVRYLGDATHSPAISRPVRIRIFPSITTNQIPSSVLKRSKNSSINIEGSINPIAGRVELRLISCDDNFKKCRLSTRIELLLDSVGEFKHRWRAQMGNWKIKIAMFPEANIEQEVKLIARYKVR